MQGGAAQSEGAPAHVWPGTRDDFENLHGVTYCRRCGRMLAADHRSDFVQAKPCRDVLITFRGVIGEPEGHDELWFCTQCRDHVDWEDLDLAWFEAGTQKCLMCAKARPFSC